MFSFSNFANNLRGGADALQSMPMGDKLMASGQLLKGQQPDWRTLMAQLGAGAPNTSGPMIGAPGQGSPFGDAAAKVSADLGAQAGLTPAAVPPSAAGATQPGQDGGMDLSQFGLGANLLAKNPFGLLGMIGGNKGFGFGGGGLMSLLGGK